jgi:drug/metabolite transporter (DMT)-like permease
VLIVQPGRSGLEMPVLFAIASASLVAVRDLYTRGIDARIPSLVVTLGTTMTVPLVGLAISPLSPAWLPPGAGEIAMLCAAAGFVSLGNVLIVFAFRSGAEVSVISPFRYSSVLWSLLSAFLVFGDVLNTVALVGAAVIVGSGLFVWQADIRRARA